MKKLLWIPFILGEFLVGSSSAQSEESIGKDTRIQATEALLPFHHSRPRKSNVTHAVIHFISDAARNPKDPFNFSEIHSVYKEYGVSAHYMIGRDGELFRLVPENRVAYHAGKGYIHGFPQYKDNLNEVSIGIELIAVGAKEEMEPILQKGTFETIDPASIGYTDEQYETLDQLLNYLYDKYPTIVRNRWHVIGHDEYAPGRKTDPGRLFDWGRIGY